MDKLFLKCLCEKEQTNGRVNGRGNKMVFFLKMRDTKTCLPAAGGGLEDRD